MTVNSPKPSGCNKDCYKYSVIARTIVQWNNLPEDTVCVHRVKPFRSTNIESDLTLSGSSFAQTADIVLLKESYLQGIDMYNMFICT